MKLSTRIDNILYHCRPSACTLFMSSACNFQCPHCTRSVLRCSKARDMDEQVVRRILESYPAIDSFTLAGIGEPTLCKSFTEVVKLLSQNRKNIGVVTNGSNSGPLLACKDADLSITISLYGYDRESYLANTGADIFAEILANYRELSGVFANVGFSLVVGRDTIQHAQRYLELFDRIDPVFVVLINHLAYDPDDPGSVDNILSERDAERLQVLRAQCRSRPYIQRLPVLIDTQQPELRCRSYTYVINVDGDGNIGGCQRQLGPDERFGNILKTADPYNSPEMIRLRKGCGVSLIHKECRFCFGNWVESGALTTLSRSRFGMFGKIRKFLR